MAKAFILDTKTTAVGIPRLAADHHQPRIIEFYGHIVDDETGESLEEIESFINPGIPIPEIVTKITTITNETIKDAPKFSKIAPQVIDFLHRADYFVAHNAAYDMAVVKYELIKIGFQATWPRAVCTVEATEFLKGYRLSLSNLHEELFGEKFADAHRARTDVEALTRCFLELKKRGIV